MQRNAINEKRFADAYRALDDMRYKDAINYVNGVLKKHPHLHLGKALKALAFIRLNENDEATKLLDHLEQKLLGDPTDVDDHTVSMIVQALKEANVAERIPRLYKRLVDSNPQSEYYHDQLYYAYIRCRDFEEAQKVALTMYRKFRKLEYQYWYITCTYMQAIRAANTEVAGTAAGNGTNLSLKIAEQACTKIYDSRTITREGIDLYLAILDYAGNHERADFVVNADIVKILMPDERAYCYKKQNQIMLANAKEMTDYNLIVRRVTTMLNHEFVRTDYLEEGGSYFSPEEWLHFEYLFKAFFKAYDLREPEDRVAWLDEVASSITSVGDLGRLKLTRGPLIGEMMFMKKIIDYGIEYPYTRGLVNHLGFFIRKFYKKPCCFVDIREFLLVLNKDDQVEILKTIAWLEEQASQDETPVEQRTVNERAVLTLLREQINRMFGLHKDLNETGRRQLADNLVAVLVQGMNAQHNKIDEVTASGLVLLAVHVLWDIHLQKYDPTSLYEILLLLEVARRNFRSDPTIKLLRMRMYSYLGATDLVYEMHNDLDIKHVQKDSMSYFLLPIQEQFGSYKNAIDIYTDFGNYFDSTDREVSEAIVHAFKARGYSKVPQLVELHRLSENSIISYYADVANQQIGVCFTMKEKALGEAMQCLKGDGQNPKWEAITDNRDLNVIANFEPDDTKAKMNDLKTATFNELVDITKLRYYLNQYIHALYFVEAKSADVWCKDIDEKLKRLQSHMDHCIAIYPDNPERRPSPHLQAPTDVRLGIFVRSGVVQFVTLIMGSATKLIRMREQMISTDLTKEDALKHCEEALAFLPSKEKLKEHLNLILPPKPDVNKPFFFHEYLYSCSLTMLALGLGGVALRTVENVIANMNTLTANLASLNLNGDKKSQKFKSKKGSRKEVAPHVARFEELRDALREVKRSCNANLNDLSEELTENGLIPKLPKVNWPSADAFEALNSMTEEVDEELIAAYKEGSIDLDQTGGGLWL